MDPKPCVPRGKANPNDSGDGWCGTGAGGKGIGWTCAMALKRVFGRDLGVDGVGDGVMAGVCA